MALEVDVGIVSWNVREDLLACLASLLASRDVRLHVVVVDNDSNDGSADAVAQRYPAVELHRNLSNVGFARAANQAIAAGQAPYALLLNPDAVVPPGAIAAMVQKLAALPTHALLVPCLVDAAGRAQHSVYPMPSLGTSLLLATGATRLLPTAGRSTRLLEGSWQSDVERDVPWAIGAAWLLRRAAYDTVGALDERYFMYAEDIDWCDRAARAGWRVRFTPEIEIVHHSNRSGAQLFGEDRTAAYLGSTIAFLRRRHGRGWVAAFIAVNAAATVGRYAAGRLIQRVAPARASSMLPMWRAHARYYTGRSRPAGRKA